MNIWTIILAFGIAVCNAEVNRIIESSAIPLRDRAYQVSLTVSGKYRCGAIIIGTTAVLTPAQCVAGESASDIKVRAGSEHGTFMGSIHRASSTVIHESYSNTTYDYDIAIVNIETPFELGDTIGLAPLASSGETVPANAIVTVSGWGATSLTDTTHAGLLRSLEIPIVTNSVCADIYRRITTVTERMFCAGYLYKIEGACTGDIGSALVYGNTVIGILSWGTECGTVANPAVYTRIAAVIDWINTQTGV